MRGKHFSTMVAALYFSPPSRTSLIKCHRSSPTYPSSPNITRTPTPKTCGVHKLDFADDQGSCTPIGIEYHHWCYRVSTLVPWLGSDGSADASSLARGPDDIFGTHSMPSLFHWCLSSLPQSWGIGLAQELDQFTGTRSLPSGIFHFELIN